VDEQILVVKRKKLFEGDYFQGFQKDRKEIYLKIIKKFSYFVKRSEVEENPEIKQIIPYQIFKYKNLYFLFKRFAKGREKRLYNKYSLGIGGHINKSDSKKNDIIIRGMKREFEEEIEYSGNYSYKLIGVLNDDSEPISAVHFGLVYLIEGDSKEIKIREKGKMAGKLVKLEEIEKIYEELEGWSKIIYRDFLKKDGRI
jgi:predicted NUDIX family phosphoesterase